MALQVPERKHEVPLNSQDEQVKDTLHSAEGELKTHIRREHGERRSVVLQPPVFTPEPGFNGGQDGGDAFLGVMQEDQKLPGTLCVATSDAKYGIDPTGRCFRRLRFGPVLIPLFSSLFLS